MNRTPLPDDPPLAAAPRACAADFYPAEAAAELLIATRRESAVTTSASATWMWDQHHRHGRHGRHRLADLDRCSRHRRPS
jgi:hypothetical protein